MEELVELFECELGIHGFSLIFLIQQVHLQVYETFSILLNQRICCRDGKFEIEVDQLGVVDLFQELGGSS
jgi:hypothetical protein